MLFYNRFQPIVAWALWWNWSNLFVTVMYTIYQGIWEMQGMFFQKHFNCVFDFYEKSYDLGYNLARKFENLKLTSF